ncbi:MAG: hypothetical protein DRP42_02675 [Tenericutes bacterium]|nr:MAG: hypothetical protein DRP42_02675 [Mycoplasmatota bacterium]
MAKDKNDDVSANEWGKLRSWLAKNKFSQAQINEAIGDSRTGKKNGEVAQDLREWIKANAGAVSQMAGVKSVPNARIPLKNGDFEDAYIPPEYLKDMQENQGNLSRDTLTWIARNHPEWVTPK